MITVHSVYIIYYVLYIILIVLHRENSFTPDTGLFRIIILFKAA